MTQYFILFFVILILSKTTNGHNRKLILLSTIILFFLFFAFRIGFTPDYYNYEEYFDRCHFSNLDSNGAIEIGFQWLCQILPSYRALLIVYSALFSICIYIALKKYIGMRYWTLAIMILFIHTPFVLGNMSGLRSSIVTCLVFIALILRVNFQKKFFPLSIGILLVSALFHRSAIVLLPLLFLPKQPFGNNAKKVIYFFAALFVFVSIFLGSELNQLVVSISGELFEDRYEMYAENFNQTRFNIVLLLKEMVVTILLYITLQFTQTEKNPLKNYLIKITAISYLFMLVPQGIGLIARYQYYFAFPCILGIPYLLEESVKKTKTVYYLCLSFIAIWDMIFLFKDGINHYTEYRTILF